MAEFLYLVMLGDLKMYREIMTEVFLKVRIGMIDPFILRLLYYVKVIFVMTSQLKFGKPFI